jgi:diaminopimelate epimerase
MEFGATFYKLSGSGNDFVAFDEMGSPSPRLPDAERVRALCRRGTGIGADGVVVLCRAPGVDYQLVYFNRDGSRAELCGNASLCSVRMAVELGHAGPDGVRFLTDSGVLTGRIQDGLPEIDLQPASELEPERRALLDGVATGDERRVGFARVGVPHVVVACADAASVDLPARAPALRHHPALRDGANVNFVSGSGRAWTIRTFERGVEEETLACGTGSVATALLLAAWGDAGPGEASGHGGQAEPAVVRLTTRSGLVHRVTLRQDPRERGPGEPVLWRPSLAGGARIVFRGQLGEGDWG